MASYRQDLPPKDGFEKIIWAARGPKRLMRGVTQLGLFVAFTTAAWVAYFYDKAARHKVKLEMMDARNAVQPFLLAEWDRALLKHCRRNRDEENELMKDVPDWKTGTLWGEPVFYNVRDRFVHPEKVEILAHVSPKDRNEFFSHKN